MRRAVRAALALSLVLLASGCLRFRGDLTIDDDALVTGTVIAAAKLSSDLPVRVTPPGTVNGSGAIRTEPYTEDGYLGTRVELTRATFAEVERFFADQGGQLVPSIPGLGSATGDDQLVAQLRMRRDGGDVVVDGRFRFPDLAGTLGTAAKQAADFEARLSITFPGEVRDSTGTTDGRTVTWTFRPGEAQDVRARAELAGEENTELVWIAVGAVTIALVIALVALFRSRAVRRRPPEEPLPPPWQWNTPGAPVPPGPGLSRPPTYGAS